MDKVEVISRTADYARQKLFGKPIGSDWSHTYRVWKMAANLAEKERADSFIVQLAALLHDIADWKYNQADITAAPMLARKWLQGLEMDEVAVSHVCEIISDVSFKGLEAKSPMRTKEGMVVQDADRLDAIGAIGIAKTFAFGGETGMLMYDPNVAPRKGEELLKIRNSRTSLNHFYEKMLLLKHGINTKTAQKIAEGRHRFIQEFLARFLNEWEGSL
jgi:uncharacterized protein